MNLKARLQRLEATQGPAATASDGPAAIGAVLDKLFALLPCDEPQFDTDGFCKRLVYPVGWQSNWDKVGALAARIASGSTTGEDAALLASLPEDALQALGMTAAEVVAFLVTADANC